jgi:hypothetical protein
MKNLRLSILSSEYSFFAKRKEVIDIDFIRTLSHVIGRLFQAIRRISQTQPLKFSYYSNENALQIRTGIDDQSRASS